MSITLSWHVVNRQPPSVALDDASPGRERVLILGAGPLAGKLLAALRTRRRRCEVLGLVDDTATLRVRGVAHRILGKLEELPEVLERVRPDRIIVALTARRGRLPLETLLRAKAQGILVEDGIEAYERLSGKLAIEALTPGALIFSREFRKSRFDLCAARLLSIATAVGAGLVLAPVLLLIALAIVLDSPGPVLFAQERVGAAGRRFRLFKFRTMLGSDEPRSEWERDNGHRITRVGKWLRRFRLDELPQFWNVLLGDMNLVGPRPHPSCNHHLFVERIPYYHLREGVLPGITGWAQVRYGYANGLEEETEKMRYDLYYVKHFSLWLDLRILLETVRTVASGTTQPRHRGRPFVVPAYDTGGRAPSPAPAFASAALRPGA
jgi:exopolysaccharide biosynthesis polyprenyl glycosylphosphotransferase